MEDWKISKWLEWFIGAQYPYHATQGNIREMYIPDLVMWSAEHLYGVALEMEGVEKRFTDSGHAYYLID